HRPGDVQIATSPMTLAVATAASALHATVHVMSPVSSGRCRGEQLAATVDTSLGGRHGAFCALPAAPFWTRPSFCASSTRWPVNPLRPGTTDATSGDFATAMDTPGT